MVFEEHSESKHMRPQMVFKVKMATGDHETTGPLDNKSDQQAL
jgi:hypothetical protein